MASNRLRNAGIYLSSAALNRIIRIELHRCLLILIATSSLIHQCLAPIALRPFTASACENNPCHNDGRCIPGQYECKCTVGWMGKYCHRRCRDIYNSCEQWAIENKCEQSHTQTNFFDVNCAVSCKICRPDKNYRLSNVPIPPSLEPLSFMVGHWHSRAIRGWRYPVDMYSKHYRELLVIAPAEVPMFGTPSINMTSYSESGNDTRVLNGFLTMKPAKPPQDVAILSTSNEGLSMIELGTLRNGILTLNITYMQVYPGMDTPAVPLGATRTFRTNGEYLEMYVTKLMSNNKLQQFKKSFRRTKRYHL